MTKIMVKPASRIESAISLGVFCRWAPSTKAIIRSRNVSPGFDVMRIKMLSERTRVPPVTELRSPPAARITGADSPVIADSSTLAAPSITSPSPGTSSPAFTRTTSPRRKADALPTSSFPSTTRRAVVSVLVRRTDSAHRFGEVREHYREPQPGRDREIETGATMSRREQIAEEKARDRRGSDLNHEHDRVAQLHARVEFDERVERGAPKNRAVEQRAGLRTAFNTAQRQH